MSRISEQIAHIGFFHHAAGVHHQHAITHSGDDAKLHTGETTAQANAKAEAGATESSTGSTPTTTTD